MSDTKKPTIWLVIGLFAIGFLLFFIFSLQGCKGPETVAAQTTKHGMKHLHYYKTR